MLDTGRDEGLPKGICKGTRGQLNNKPILLLKEQHLKTVVGARAWDKPGDKDQILAF